MTAKFYDTFSDYKDVVFNALDLTYDRFMALAGGARTGRNFTNDEERQRTVEHYESVARNARAAKLALRRDFEDN